MLKFHAYLEESCETLSEKIQDSRDVYMQFSILLAAYLSQNRDHAKSELLNLHHYICRGNFFWHLFFRVLTIHDLYLFYSKLALKHPEISFRSAVSTMVAD